MIRAKVATWLLLVTFILLVSLRLMAAAGKNSVSHDESISYLAATGYQALYGRAREGDYPYGQWVAVAEWKQFQERPQPFIFRQIGRDLAEYDIHPPLYFWLLNLWLQLTGVKLWSGSLLNLLIDLATAFLLWRLALQVLKDRFESAVVTFIWAVSPAVLETAGQARQYSLFGLCTVLFIWHVVQWATRRQAPSPLVVAGLSISTAAGALVHFHFILVVIGSLIFLAFRWGRSGWQRLATAITAIIAGYGIFLLLHPSFYLSLQRLAYRQALEAQYLSDRLDIYRRIYATINTYTGFFTYGLFFQAALFSATLAFLLWLLLALARNRPWFLNVVRRTDWTGVYILYFCFWLSGVTLLLYFSYRSPIHAMSARHLSAIWPFLAFLPVFMLRLLARQRQLPAALALCLLLFLGGTASVWRLPLAVAQPDEPAWLATSNLLLVDTVEEGILPRILWSVPGDVRILAADQRFFISNPQQWLHTLDGLTFYASDLSYQNQRAQRQAILDLMDQYYEVELLGSGPAATDLYQVRKR
jgi:hypothetical protein